MQSPTDLFVEIPQKLEEVIVKALSRDPAERHQRATDMKCALADVKDSDTAQNELATMMNTIFSQARDQAHEEIRSWARAAA